MTFWLAIKPLPLAAALLDAQFRVLDLNASLEALVGHTRASLLGTDLITLQPLAEQESAIAERQRLCLEATAVAPFDSPVQNLRSAPAIQWRGRLQSTSVVGAPLASERYARCTLHPSATVGPADESSAGAWLLLLHDETPEYSAREQARHARGELDQWFALATAGMLVYDATGLIVRCNAAFEALVEQVPEVLAQANPPLQWLLGWTGGFIDPALAHGAPPLLRQALLPLADGRRRRLVARLALISAEGDAQREGRVMAVVEDRSAEDERDLAQLERGMLMDTARVGVATFDPALGWLGAQTVAQDADATGAMFSIGRPMVLPASRPEYERLQRALRSGERAEVRYAVQHPELGLRWLLTRVEPGALAGGRATTSVVTLDVTDQEHALRRHEQLLRELTTILDSSTAGIAYLRGPVLVRCNRRFERMLGFEPGEAAGASLQELLARQNAPASTISQALEALESLAGGLAFETELELGGVGRPGPGAAQLVNADLELQSLGPIGQHDRRGSQWVALSLRRAETEGGRAEAVAVLTDVTRLKQQQAELEALLHDRDLMFSLSEVGIVYLRGARIERANQAMSELTGYSVPQLSAMDWSQLHESARDCAEFEAAMAGGLQGVGRYSAEMRMRRRDGSVRWVQVSARPVQVEGAEAAAAPEPSLARDVICSFVDVDERYRARETLSLQAERTRELLNSVLVGIVTVSASGIEWMNRSACRMFGGELSDFLGQPIHRVATPERDHPLRRSDWLVYAAAGSVPTFECRLRGLDGRQFWVVGNAVASALANEAAQVTFAFLDIDRRRQAEVSISRAQASLQHMIETAPLAIALFDASTQRILQMNQGAAAFLAPSPPSALPELDLLDLPLAPGTAAAVGQWVQNCKPELARSLAGWLQEAQHSGQALVREWRDESATALADTVMADFADSTYRPGEAGSAPVLRVWECRLAPLRHEGDSGQEVILVATEVTEQRAAEQARLRAAIAQREVLVREVHHRIKNNLQGVAGLLQQHAQRRPEVATVLTEAVAQVQAIAQVYGLQVGAQGPLAVAPLVRSIAQSVARTFGQAITMVQSDGEIDGLGYELPEIETIPFALVVNELLTNAVKHGQGPVQGQAHSQGQTVQCAVLAQGEALTLRIAGPGQLPPGFDVTAIRAGVSGLALVRALLPRRNSTLNLQAEGDQVVASVTLRPPSVRRVT